MSDLPKHSSLEKLIDFCDDLLSIKDTVRLELALKEQSSIFFKVQRLLAVEADALDGYMRKESLLELQTRRYYEGKLPNEMYVKKPNRYPATTKADCDLQVKADPLFQEINKIVKDAKRRVEFLESVLWRVKERGTDINGIIEWKKYIEAGI